MELDQQTQALLARLQQQMRIAAERVEGPDIATARATTRDMFLALAGSADAAAETRDLSIATDSGALPARLYRPAGGGNLPLPLPLILFFHGGGWCMADLDCYDIFLRSMCGRSGALILSVDYRLAPEHKFPAAVEDGLAAIRWAAERAEQLGADKARLALMGDSAGGNLAAVLAQRLRYHPELRPAAQLLLYPVLDVSSSHDAYPSRRRYGGGDYLLTCGSIDATTAWYLGPGDTPDEPAVSPLRAHDLAALPPTAIVTAGHDPLCDEGRLYAERLRAAGVPVRYRCFEGAIHAFLSFGELDIAQTARAYLADVIKEMLFLRNGRTLPLISPDPLRC